MKHFTSMLSSHEPLCSILTTVPQPPPEVLYATHSFHQPHISSPRFQH
ncbi:basic leucine zipper ATF-like transcription factor [Chelydra serpentina]|uniref:Basic leucine zipper ATF-like transcription factor n=2 Tax=Durocryptodira TaxID=1579337 RepID=A0A8T1T703_CHESE|nr:basic leucine zipper ATF-like transcription factor [Chelydra serpentina]